MGGRRDTDLGDLDRALRRSEELAAAARERRHARLDVAASLAYEHPLAPELVGGWLDGLVESGAVGPEELANLLAHVEAVAGTAYAEEAFLWPAERAEALEARSERARVAEVERQVARLAPRLGIPQGEVQVRLDDEAARRLATRGAEGLAHEGVVYLDPAGFDPTTSRGRYLLAHELTHVAQGRVGGTGEPWRAEIEAARVGRAWEGGGQLERPRMPMVRGAEAADVDAAGADEQEQRGRVEAAVLEVMRGAVEAATDGGDLYAELVGAVEGVVGEAWRARLASGMAEVGAWIEPVVGTLDWLREALTGENGSEVASRDQSFGLGWFADQVAKNVTDILTGRTGGHDAMRGLLAAAASRPLELELQGAIEELRTLRGVYRSAKGAARVRAGQEIARVARFAVTLDRRLHRGLRGSGLEDEPDVVLDTATAADAASSDEAAFLAAEGDEVGQLKPETVRADLDGLVPSAGEEVIDNEEFLPGATDDASHAMLRQHVDHLAGEEKALEALKTKVLPKAKTPQAFAQVYRQWFGLFSRAERDADPEFQQSDALYRTAFDALGVAGLEGAMVQATLMDSLGGAVPLGEATTAFGGQTAPHLRWTGEAKGRAGAARYEQKAVYVGQGQGEGLVGEARSRKAMLAAGSRRGKAEAKHHQATGAVGKKYSAESAEIDKGWAYLVVPERLDSEVTGEIKVLPKETAEFLLALEQHYAAVRAPHRPGVGDKGIRGGGLGEAKGVDPERLPNQETSKRGAIAREHRAAGSIARRTGAEGARGRNPSATGTVIGLLEQWMDGYLSGAAPGDRLMAIARIAAAEHPGLADELVALLSGDALAEVAVQVLRDVALMAGLKAFGKAGQALAEAVAQVRRANGRKQDVGTALVLALWLERAIGAGSLGAARRAAYTVQPVAGALVEFLRDEVVGAAVGGAGRLRAGVEAGRAGSAWVGPLARRLTGPDGAAATGEAYALILRKTPPTTVDDAMRAIEVADALDGTGGLRRRVEADPGVKAALAGPDAELSYEQRLGRLEALMKEERRAEDVAEELKRLGYRKDGHRLAADDSRYPPIHLDESGRIVVGPKGKRGLQQSKDAALKALAGATRLGELEDALIKRGLSERDRAFIHRLDGKGLITEVHAQMAARGRGDVLARATAGLTRDYGEHAYRQFKHALRDGMIALVTTDASGRRRPADQQMKVLRDLLDRSTESGDKGALFAAYNEWRLVQRGGSSEVERLELVDRLPKPGQPEKVEQVRRKLEGDPPTFVDGVVRVSGPAEPGEPPPGVYAVEYKSGGGAFKPEQAVRYGKAMAAGGGKLVMEDGQVYDGVVYLCSSKKEADGVARRLRGMPRSMRHVAYYTDGGELLWQL